MGVCFQQGWVIFSKKPPGSLKRSSPFLFHPLEYLPTANPQVGWPGAPHTDLTLALRVPCPSGRAARDTARWFKLDCQFLPWKRLMGSQEELLTESQSNILNPQTGTLRWASSAGHDNPKAQNGLFQSVSSFPEEKILPCGDQECKFFPGLCSPGTFGSWESQCTGSLGLEGERKRS